MKVFFNLLLTCLLIKKNVLTFVILIKNYDIIILILFLPQVNYCHQFKSVNGPDVGIRMIMILFNFSANWQWQRQWSRGRWYIPVSRECSESKDTSYYYRWWYYTRWWQRTSWTGFIFILVSPVKELFYGSQNVHVFRWLNGLIVLKILCIQWSFFWFKNIFFNLWLKNDQEKPQKIDITQFIDDGVINTRW